MEPWIPVLVNAKFDGGTTLSIYPISNEGRMTDNVYQRSELPVSMATRKSTVGQHDRVALEFNQRTLAVERDAARILGDGQEAPQRIQSSITHALGLYVLKAGRGVGGGAIARDKRDSFWWT